MKINRKSIELLNQILEQYESFNLNNLDYASLHELTSIQ